MLFTELERMSFAQSKTHAIFVWTVMIELGPAKMQVSVRLDGTGKQALNTSMPPQSLVSEPPMSITQQSLVRAMSLTQSPQSQGPSQCPNSAMGKDIPLSFNTLKVFEAAASLQGLCQALVQG